MIAIEWDGLVGCLSDLLEAPYGMHEPHAIIAGASFGNEPDTRGRKRLERLVRSLVDEATRLAGALGEEALPRSSPLVSFMPSAAGARPNASCTWRASNGMRFVASTVPMSGVVGLNTRFSVFEGVVRCVEIDAPPPGWA